jgi:hypothetical protein
MLQALLQHTFLKSLLPGLLNDLPVLLFFTTYTLLVLFWAEVYHQAKVQTTSRLRPTFLAINIFVYSVQAFLVFLSSFNVLRKVARVRTLPAYLPAVAIRVMPCFLTAVFSKRGCVLLALILPAISRSVSLHCFIHLCVIRPVSLELCLLVDFSILVLGSGFPGCCERLRVVWGPPGGHAQKVATPEPRPHQEDEGSAYSKSLHSAFCSIYHDTACCLSLYMLWLPTTLFLVSNVHLLQLHIFSM